MIQEEIIKMNGLINYINKIRLIQLNKKIENIQGELTYYDILREEGLSNEIPEEREGKLILKLNEIYLHVNKLRKSNCIGN